MDWGGPAFIVAIILVSTLGWLVNNWIRAKHGYPLEDEWGGETEPAEQEIIARLRDENERLLVRLNASEDRLAVLEKIVTEPGYQLSTEIEKLREEADGSASKRSAA
ncbi:hypothetical protein FHS61_001609 [Altererythrobacter atlanticus]|uniref:Uncharacterized protein n=1 Tax=Croceibacterium atlanticum TaxID=1267766 RepID=A0A0F7KX75_9SPHN|nr:hypothetical protein [Croceibacterium atlanticum]AKH41085.1 hypothetical protein WYH_00018 [Croceibacterium atlanticum]MBB5732600.1 hypothetical protein [Croceibacterium atlanticum]